MLRIYCFGNTLHYDKKHTEMPDENAKNLQVGMELVGNTAECSLAA